MLAASLTGPQTFSLQQVEVPPPGPGEVIVEVVGCGVCGSNLHDWYRPPVPAMAVPGAVGHEISGRIAAVGRGVVDRSPGDGVVVEPSSLRACGTCPACHEGATWFCAGQRPGVLTYGFAEQVLAPAAATYAVPAGLDLAEAVLVEPVACGVHALRHSWTARADGRVDGREVVVIGAGMLGLAAVMAARWLGAATVTAVARHPHQADAATACGADDVVDGAHPALEALLRSLRPDVVVEAVGGDAGTLAVATGAAAWRGEVVVLGGFSAPQPVDAAALTAREVRLFFPVSYAARDGVHDYDVALELAASGRFPLTSLVTHRFPLEAVADAFEVAADKRSGSIRVLVGPGR